MELYDGLLTRRSARIYDRGRRASDADIEKILKAAMHAPSAHGRFPWEFVVIRSGGMLDAAAAAHPYAKFVPEAGTAIVVCGDLVRQHKNGDAQYWHIDCSAATQNILLAAHSLGLASCWCGIYPVESRMEDFKNLLSLPEHIAPFSIVALGYAAKGQTQPQNRFDESKIHFC